MLKKLAAFLRLCRPVTLLNGVLLYALGVVVARFEGHKLSLEVCQLGQLFVSSMQLMMQYLEAYWQPPDTRPNAPPPAVSRETVFATAMIWLGIGSAAAIMLTVQYQAAGPAAWAAIVLIFLGAFFYASPPLALMNSGYGELTTTLVHAGLIPAFGYILITGHPGTLLLLAVAPLMTLYYVTLVALELTTFLEDEATGKKNLLVRLGRRRGPLIHNVLLAVTLALAALGTFIGLPGQVAFSVVITAPLAIWQISAMRHIQRGEPVSLSHLSFVAHTLFSLTAYLIAFSFWVIG